MSDVVFPIFAGLAIILIVIPLPLQLRSRNIALICYMLWILSLTLVYFINSTIWFRSTRIVASVWCDIATKIAVGAQVAVPTCSLAILRKLERIASTRQANLTAMDKRYDTLIDCILCIAIPVVYMTTHVVVQGHRFDIVEGFGCQYDLYPSWAMLFLFTIPPLFFIGLSSIYAALALRWFIVRRRQFRAVLASRSAGVTTSRFVRLLILTSLEMLISLPCQVINAYYNLKSSNFSSDSFPLPYPSWEYVHEDFAYIGQATQSELRAVEPSFLVIAEMLRWAVLVGAFAAFGCLGCSQDNLNQGKALLSGLRHLFRRQLAARPAAHAGASERITVAVVTECEVQSGAESTFASNAGDKHCFNCYELEQAAIQADICEAK